VAQSILEDLPEQAFTADTITRMYRLVDKGKTDADFQKLVYGLVNGAMPGQWKNYRKELNTVFSWYKKNVDYRRDPYGVELLQDVWSTLDRKRGDCDDATVWLGAAAEILGSPVRIVTVSTRPDKEPVHVYPEAYVGGKWIAMDATVPGAALGWSAQHITDKHVWTRKELGLPGADDLEGIEGFGMRGLAGLGDDPVTTLTNQVTQQVTQAVASGAVPSDPASVNAAIGKAVDAAVAAAPAAPAPTTPPAAQLSRRPGNGYGNDFDFGTMTPVSGKLAPGIPDDVSHTYGAPIPGAAGPTQRRIWRAPIANNSDWTSNPAPGGGVYGPALPIKSMPTPSELWYLVDRAVVSKVLDPDSAWWGKVPTSKKDLNRMFPGSERTMANYLTDIASVPASAIAEVEGDVRKQLAMGEIGLGELGAAIDDGLNRYSKGRPQWTKTPAAQKTHRGFGKAKGRAGAPGQQRRFLVPRPKPPIIQGGGLNGLGDAASDLAATISSATGVAVPPSTVSSIISAVTGQPATPPPASSTGLLSAIPIGVLAALGLAAYFIMKRGPKKYKSNPSRRRSSRRGGRRSGGIDTKTLLLWGGGGLAAYFLLLRPGAPLLPAAKPAGVTLPGGVNTAQIAGAAGGIASAISKLFGGSGTTTTPAATSTSAPSPSSSAPASDPFAFNTYGASAPAADTSDTSGIVASL
jgi:hypothetical protein